MLELHERWPEYDFAGHKGYITDVHSAALERHGPCPEHRMRFVNVRSARGRARRAGPPGHRPGSAWSMMSRMSPALMPRHERAAMSTEDLEKYETEMELQLYREYRDIVRQFTYVVETERRFYLANSVDLQVREAGGEVYFELKLSDAWVWDMYRPARFVRNVRVLTFKDVNVEELDKPDLELPDNPRMHLTGIAPRQPDRCRVHPLAAVHRPRRRPQRRPALVPARGPARSSGADCPEPPRTTAPRSAPTASASPPPTLTDAGLRVLDRNWRCREGELDIVARDGDALVFCEVKTRAGRRLRPPRRGGHRRQAAPAAAAGPALAGRARRARPRRCGSTSSGCWCGRPGPALVTHLRAAFS